MRITKLIAAAALFAASFGGATVSAQAQEDAKIRVGHFSSDAPAIDIYLDGRKTFAQVRFPLMSAYTPVAPGAHTIDIRPAGAAATDAPLLSVKADLAAGKPYLVAALGSAAKLEGKVFTDDLTPPAKGKARLRVIHAATGGPAIDAVAGGSTKLFSNIAFGSAADYKDLDASKYELSVRAAGSSTQIVGKVISLQSGGVYSIVAVGDPAGGGVSLRGFADLAPTGAATSTAVDPTGADPSSSDTTTPTETTVAAGDSAAAATEAVSTEAATAETVAPATEAAQSTDAAVETTTTIGGDDSSASDTTPVSGVDTGFGGMSNGQSAATILAMIGFAAAFAGLGLRRRNA